jgi:hypothetical protein
MEGYMTRRSGTVGHEILSPEGEIVAWTIDGCWAAIIVGLLDRVEGRNPTHDTRNPSAPD